MQHSYICPKCNSSDVIEIKGNSMTTSATIALTKWQMKSAILDRYVCAHCGFTEEYVQMTKGFRKWADGELNKSNRGPSDLV